LKKSGSSWKSPLLSRLKTVLSLYTEGQDVKEGRKASPALKESRYLYGNWKPWHLNQINKPKISKRNIVKKKEIIP